MNKVQGEHLIYEFLHQTSAQVDEELETELLQCQFDKVLINRAINAQQALHGSNDVVEAYVVFKVRIEG
jgi:hypothetical protein